jgi:L-threonylcarbamoyladenylate synthase
MISPWHLRSATRVLRAGGIIAYPTEAVYGLGCDPLNPEAVLRLLVLKQRPWQKGLILIAASLEQLTPFLAPLTPDLEVQLSETWPGPVTWLLPASEIAPPWLTGEHDSIAVRVTDHPLAAGLCRHFGAPIVSTSANRAGQLPAKTALGVRGYFGTSLDYILHGPLGGYDRPSEIRDGRTGNVIRPG